MQRRSLSLHKQSSMKITIKTADQTQNKQSDSGSDRDNKQEVLNLNYFKVKRQKNNFNLQHMLQQGKIQEEDGSDPNFPSPAVNTRLIHNIFQIQYQDKPQTQNKGRSKFETADRMLKQTNQQLVNQILLNKMRKRNYSQHDLSNSTSNVLQSFKSLTSMFKSVHSVVDYHYIVNQIRQSQAQINIPIESEQNLERQQFNFNCIIAARMNQLKINSSEMIQIQYDLQSFRKNICRLRAESAQQQQLIADIKLRYAKQRQNANTLWDKEYVLNQLQTSELVELNKAAQQIIDIKDELDRDMDQLQKKEEYFQEVKALKKKTKSDLAEFLKQVLSSEEIQIQDPISSIVKLLHQINEAVTPIDLPNFLDIYSKNFILTNAKIQIKLDELKQLLRDQKTNTTPVKKSVGLRFQYEEKIKQVMMTFKDMKRKQTKIKKIDQGYDDNLSSIQTPHKIQQTKTSLSELEQQLIQIDDLEVERLRQLYQGKIPNSTLQKLIKSIQAQWGFKQMNTKLNLILQNNGQKKVTLK
ncbi:hypothetical protein pb186bvf_006118 [Paramecium bursaria]